MSLIRFSQGKKYGDLTCLGYFRMNRNVNDQHIYKGKEKITVGCDQKKMSAPLFSTSSSSEDCKPC